MASAELDDFSPEASDDDDYDAVPPSLSNGAFANEGNLPGSIDYIQAALASHGLSRTMSYDTGKAGLVDACNAIYALLQRLQQQVERTERAEDQIVRLNHSLKMAKQANTNLQASVEDREREVGNLKNKVSAATLDTAGAKDKMATERRELSRKCVDLESRFKRMQMELKRKEQELGKANAKLRELLESKGAQARHMRQLSTALSVHSRTASVSSVRSEGSDVGNAAAAESRIQTLKDTYETKYTDLYNKYSDLQTAYSRLQETYKGMLFQQLRSTAKENVKYAANDATDDDDDE